LTLCLSVCVLFNKNLSLPFWLNGTSTHHQAIITFWAVQKKRTWCGSVTLTFEGSHHLEQETAKFSCKTTCTRTPPPSPRARTIRRSGVFSPHHSAVRADTFVRAMNKVNGKCHFSKSFSAVTLEPIYQEIAQLIKSATPPYKQTFGSVGSKGVCLRMRENGEVVIVRRLHCVSKNVTLFSLVITQLILNRFG